MISLDRLGGAKYINARDVLHVASDWGKAWRVVSGAIRLDQACSDGLRFAGLALAGDWVGAEVMESGAYAFSAKALIPTVLMPLSPPATRQQAAQGPHVMVMQQRRTADLLALRSGAADERVMRLVSMIAHAADAPQPDALAPTVSLPFLRDMADITDLTMESVSRAVTKLRKIGVISYVNTSKKAVSFHPARLREVLGLEGLDVASA